MSKMKQMAELKKQSRALQALDKAVRELGWRTFLPPGADVVDGLVIGRPFFLQHVSDLIEEDLAKDGQGNVRSADLQIKKPGEGEQE